MKKVYVILPLLCISAQIQAFSWHKCKKVMFHKAEGNWTTLIFSGITNQGISSGQFTTSTGECSAMRMSDEEERLTFYHLNFNHLRNDMSKGGGERLNALYDLYDCREDQRKRNNEFFKSNFKELVAENSEASFRQVNLTLDRTCYE